MNQYAFVKVLFLLLYLTECRWNLGLEEKKKQASPGGWTSREPVALFCLTQTDACSYKDTYICMRSALTTSGQLNAKAKRTLDAHTGEYIQDPVTLGSILRWRGSHVEEFLHRRERKHIPGRSRQLTA